jgi:DNA invertase Pin-like site-specific DNA recombinase
MGKRAAIYLRVSTDEQTTENQERALREVAARSRYEIVAVYRDEGISGSKGRDKRPGFDAMHAFGCIDFRPPRPARAGHSYGNLIDIV